jgi:hypothetical protein
MRDKKPLPKTALQYVLLGLVPYTNANLKLVFNPHTFFNDLEKISEKKSAALKQAYNRALSDQYFYMDKSGYPVLTVAGRKSVAPFVAEKLGKGARLLVIFDITEDEAWKRQRLRRLLNYLNFQQVQKSVWASNMDYREIIRDEIKELDLRGCVQILEAIELKV